MEDGDHHALTVVFSCTHSHSHSNPVYLKYSAGFSSCHHWQRRCNNPLCLLMAESFPCILTAPPLPPDLQLLFRHMRLLRDYLLFPDINCPNSHKILCYNSFMAFLWSRCKYSFPTYTETLFKISSRIGLKHYRGNKVRPEAIKQLNERSKRNQMLPVSVQYPLPYSIYYKSKAHPGLLSHSHPPYLVG